MRTIYDEQLLDDVKRLKARVNAAEEAQASAEAAAAAQAELESVKQTLAYREHLLDHFWTTLMQRAGLLEEAA